MLGLFLFITPLVLPLVAIPHALVFPPKHLNDWVAQPPRWDALYLLGRYFSDPILALSSLSAFGAGLWLLRARLSWKNGVTGLIVAVPWLYLLLAACILMSFKVAVFT